MTLFEDNTHVFIVRIWFERREIEGATEEWRAVIQHVPSGQRHYLKDLDTILDFITSYLLKEGNVNLGAAGEAMAKPTIAESENAELTSRRARGHNSHS